MLTNPHTTWTGVAVLALCVVILAIAAWRDILTLEAVLLVLTVALGGGVGNILSQDQRKKKP